MARVKGFEVRNIQSFSGEGNITLQHVDLYADDQKVGTFRDDATEDLPALHIEPAYQKRWQEALAYFNAHLSCDNPELDGAELLYYLLSLTEWEAIYTECQTKGYPVLAVLEEIDVETCYRTGGYKVFTAPTVEALNTDETLNTLLIQPHPKREWRKTVFTSLDDLNLN